MKKTQEINDNGVKGACSPSEGSSPGRCSTAQQRRPGRHSATAQTQRQKLKRINVPWTHEDNREVMLCYYKSDPNKYGYRKRLHKIWKDRNCNEAKSEQRLVDQVRIIKNNTNKKNWLTSIELQEIESLAKNNTPVHSNTTKVQSDADMRKSPGQDTEHRHHEESRNVNTTDSCADIEKECNLEVLEKLKIIYERIETLRNTLPIPNMKNLNRKNLVKTTKEVNKAIKYIKTANISEANNLIYAAMLTVSELMGIQIVPLTEKEKKKKKTPPWKQRIENTLQKKRKDLSRLVQLKEKNLKNQKIKEDLIKKYVTGNKTLTEAIEVLKQDVIALKSKIERYGKRFKFYKDNKTFETNQRKFYQELTNEKQNGTHPTPDKGKTLEFWSNIWENDEKHNEKAQWISDLKEKNEKIKKQNNISITTKNLKKALKKMKNWKSAGPDKIQGYWLKNFTNIHETLSKHLQKVLDGDIPAWIAKGRTALILKNPDEPTKVSNYRPITCLTTTWKLLTSIIADEIYNHLEESGLIPWQQKGCKRKSRGTKDQLLIDKLLTKHAKRNHRNLRMTWIDYKKAYDSVPHSWILECLKQYGIADNIIQFIKKSMQLWKTTLTLLQETIGEVKILCGIFQGDSLSPILFILCLIPLSQILNETTTGYNLDNELINHLLYMDDLKLYASTEKQINSLVNTVQIFSKDIRMNFGFNKCAKVTIIKGNITEGQHIKIPDGNEIKNLDLDEHYKYLGFLESDQISSKKIKENSTKQYKKRLRLILKTSLHGRNQIMALNTFAIPVITYTAGIIKWTIEELQKLDRTTRKQMTMHGALHPRADIDRLYIPRKRGGRGLISVEEAVRKEENALGFYASNSSETLLKRAKNQFFKNPSIDTDQFKKQQMEIREEKWKTKKLHGKWYETQTQANTKTNDWMIKSNLKPATESLITAAQDQALNTNWFNKNILHGDNDGMCRRCRVHQETIQHIISGCPELAQTAYLNRHNQVASYIHWSISKKENLACKNNWYDHIPEKIIENENIKILYDFTIRTDKKIQHNRPDLVIFNKLNNSTIIADIACPMDHNTKEKEKEKVEKYQELKEEIERIWKTKAKVIPIVVGALGVVSDNLNKHLNNLGLENVRISHLQKTVLLKTGNILRRHLAT